jgi:hypothetical protein
MLSLTKEGLQEIVYDSDRDDYFYKKSGDRVPDNLRRGFYTTVFRQSSKRRLEEESQEAVDERHIKYEDFKAKMKAKYAPK